VHALGLAAQKLQIGERSQTAAAPGKRNKKTKNARRDAGPDAGASKKDRVAEKKITKKKTDAGGGKRLSRVQTDAN
jgi:hypothetical protein